MRIGDLADAEKVNKLNLNFSDIFSKDAEDYENARCKPLFFKVEAPRPLRCAPYRLSPIERKFVEAQIAEWLRSGRIRHSESPWASPAMVVDKEGGPGVRLVIDFGRMNQFIDPANFPPANAQSILYQLAGRTIFSKLDFKSAYLQIPVDESCLEYLSFVTDTGQYEFNYVPF